MLHGTTRETLASGIELLWFKGHGKQRRPSSSSLSLELGLCWCQPLSPSQGLSAGAAAGGQCRLLLLLTSVSEATWLLGVEIGRQTNLIGDHASVDNFATQV
mmetsp:Transcript_41555/g.74660  ORF Transcript_41555/g.74660 Transcript_41555/m.74660 type:complete len:102 (+) Transcript_41555:86-391(+)